MARLRRLGYFLLSSMLGGLMMSELVPLTITTSALLWICERDPISRLLFIKAGLVLSRFSTKRAVFWGRVFKELAAHVRRVAHD